nr:MAG TPA: hypothetical protein [Caudoviricetes sp.]
MHTRLPSALKQLSKADKQHRQIDNQSQHFKYCHASFTSPKRDSESELCAYSICHILQPMSIGLWKNF